MDCILISVHGIRTFGQWQHRLETLVAREGARRFEVDSIDYGYFSVIAFYFPFVRALAVRRVRKLLLKILSTHAERRVYVVAHSFGTHLVAWALRGLTAEQRAGIRIHTIIFAGSVLHPRFRWDKLLEEHGGCVHRVINDCGTQDAVLILSQCLVPLASMAGRVGFRGVINERFRNRYFRHGHSGYFMTAGKPNDFMEQWWLPLLTTDGPIEPHDDRGGSAVAGLKTFLINNAEPLKLLGYLGFLYLGSTPLRHLYHDAERSQQAELVRSLADAAMSQPSGAADSARALLLARQALLFEKDFRTHNLALVDRALRTAMSRPHLNVTLSESTRDFTAADISSDARWLAIADDDGSVWLWKIDSDARTRSRLPYSGGIVRAVRFRPDSKELLAVTDTGVVLSWGSLERERKFHQYLLPLARGIQIASISIDATRLAAAMEGGRIGVYPLGESARDAITLCCHTKPVTALAFHPLLNDVLISGGMDGAVRLWKWSVSTTPLAQWNGSAGPIASLAWEQGGSRLAVGTGATFANTEGSVLIGYPLNQPFRMEERARHRGAVSAVAFGSEQGMLASAGAGDRNIALRQLASDAAPAVQLSGHQGAVNRLVFDPQGRYLISIDAGARQSVPSAARLWYLRDPPAFPRAFRAHEAAVADLAFAPKRTLLASVGGFDGTIKLYDVDRNLTVADFSSDEATAESLGFSPNGTIFATGSGSVLGQDPDARLRLWGTDSQTKSPQRILDGFKSDVKSLAFSIDGKWLAAAGHLDREIRLWDLDAASDTPAIIATADTQLSSMAFHPALPLLAWAGSDANVYLRQIGAETTVTLPGHTRPITALAFTADGRRVLSGDIAGTILTWRPNARSRKPLTTLEQPSPVKALAVSPDGLVFASGGEDGIVRIWDADGVSSDFSALGRPGPAARALSFSPNGQYLAAGYADGQILLWPSTTSLAEQVCAIAQRNLTKAEWIGDDPSCTCEHLPCEAGR